MVISDLGANLNSEIFTELVKLMVMSYVFSIADRHVNGSGRTIKEVVIHLRAIVYDSSIRAVYDVPLFVPSVQDILNSHRSAETDFTPFELTFGTHNVLYQELFKDCKTHPPHQFLNTLLLSLKTASTNFQRSLDLERNMNVSPASNNKFVKGDFVLFDAGPKPNPKMPSRNKGPFRVIDHVKNDVQVRNLETNAM